MAVIYSNLIKQERMEVVRDRIDSGKLKLYTAGYALLLVEIDLDSPAANVSGGTLTLLGVPLSGTAVAAGDAAIAEITEGDTGDTVAINGLTVGVSGTNIIIDNVNIASGQTVTITGGTIVHG